MGSHVAISIFSNSAKHYLGDKLDISASVDILTSEDMKNTPLESRMWFRMNFTSTRPLQNCYFRCVTAIADV